MKKKELKVKQPTGKIYGDTGRIEDELQLIGFGDFESKKEFKEFLEETIFDYKELTKYRIWIYQSTEKLYVVEIEDIL